MANYIKPQNNVKKTDSEYNVRMAKGQAMNLAVAEAIQAGKAKDAKYIYSAYIRYYELGQLFQSASIEDIKDALNAK